MLDWLQNLPVVWMTVVVFLATYLVTGVIYWVVATLAVGERARAFKADSPNLLQARRSAFLLASKFLVGPGASPP
jgi:uncharacterized membrane protein